MLSIKYSLYLIILICAIWLAPMESLPIVTLLLGNSYYTSSNMNLLVLTSHDPNYATEDALIAMNS